MSLAATLSASGMRPASFLPAIKCSNCGDEIEIARMGEHICTGSEQDRSVSHHQPRPSPPALSNPYGMPSWPEQTQQQQHQAPPSPSSSAAPNWGAKLPAAQPFASSPLQHAHSPSDSSIHHPPALQPASAGYFRPAKPAIPRIDPNVANKPFLAPSYPRSQSPSSPVLSIRSARSGSRSGSRPPMSRNHTLRSPMIRDRSPSPELASNLDCAFPSFPTSSSRPGTSNGRKTPSNNDRAPSRAGTQSEKQTFGMEPRSPRTNGGEILMKRSNTMKSGPFEAGRRSGSREEKNAALPASLAIAAPTYAPYERQRSPERQNSDQLPARKASLPKDTPMFNTGFHDEPEEDLSAPDSIPAALRIADRSNSFPQPFEDSRGASRSPEMHNRGRRPSIAASIKSELGSTRQADGFPRPESRNDPRTDPRIHDAPPVPKPVQQYRQGSKHAPSESASSASSTTLSYSNAVSSEGPSPISSAASSVDIFSPISQASATEVSERPKSVARPAGYSTKSQQQNPGLRAEQPAKRSPPPNFARPRLRSTDSAAPEPLQSMAEVIEPPAEPTTSHETQRPWPSRSTSAGPNRLEQSRSPPGTDRRPPALTIPPPSGDYDPYKPRSPAITTRTRAKSNASTYSNYQPDPISAPPLSPMPPMPTDMPMRPLQRRNTSAKPVCRGCNLVIEGKSVKAADGRLTGRWHKQCFTCKTCAQPFATADFYVINDQPFCKQHYHEKNGSVCHGCSRGIEGQYFETGNNAAGGPDRKYHPACFTCHDCHLILSNDYFEIAGRVYCERHALTAMRGQARPGNAVLGKSGPGALSAPSRRELMAERRTTKLMMM